MGNDVSPDDRVLLQLDSRGRISLGALGAGRKHYLATAEYDGTILLQPAVVMTTAELALARNPKLAAEIEQALTDPNSRSTRPRPQRVEA